MKKKKHPSADISQLAKSIVEIATDENPPEESQHIKAGRLGGQKGGRARSEKLTPEQRSDIAKKAAKARWDLC